jgi:CBS domain-containing protein
MGEQKVPTLQTDDKKAQFIRHLLDDVKALEYMLEHGMFETGITRIGAEQEFCLVAEDWRPAKNSLEILKEIDDPHFTTELARYNLEINLDPVTLKGACLSEMEGQLISLLEKATRAAENHNSKVILTGILPTISKPYLQMDYITPRPRYLALNDRLMKLRTKNFHLHIMGVHELSITHDSVLFEACNTSFQLHLQIEPTDFISSFNWAQAIAGPVMSICANSPMLLGRELWSETRIALFRQSIDTRNISLALKNEMPRVAFGSNWASGSPATIYKDNIAQYKVILSQDIKHNSLEMVQDGKIPKLEALNLHSGTIYPWNRACYGVSDGKPHLRIENRYIPAGPSVLDEMANFALWIGLMMGRPKKYDDIARVMDFKDAKSNFIKAARTGKSSILRWDQTEYCVKDLMEKVMLPMAESGLEKAGIDSEDIKRLLGVIRQRITGKSGSEWMVSNYRKLRKTQTVDSSLRMITQATYQNQKENHHIAKWPDIDDKQKLKNEANKVGHIMSTKVLTVREKELAEMATSIMQWKNIHHVPVENSAGELCGLLTWTHAQKFRNEKSDISFTVEKIMTKDVITVETSTTIKKAIAIMKKNEIGCLPVIQAKELVGIITIKDVIRFDHD